MSIKTNLHANIKGQTHLLCYAIRLTDDIVQRIRRGEDSQLKLYLGTPNDVNARSMSNFVLEVARGWDALWHCKGQGGTGRCGTHQQNRMQYDSCGPSH